MIMNVIYWLIRFRNVLLGVFFIIFLACYVPYENNSIELSLMWLPVGLYLIIQGLREVTRKLHLAHYDNESLTKSSN